VRVEYRDADDEPVNRADFGYAALERALDAQGREAAVSYYAYDASAASFAPVEHAAYGYARYEALFSGYENLEGARYTTAEYRYYNAGWGAEKGWAGLSTEKKAAALVNRKDVGYAIRSDVFSERGDWVDGKYYGRTGAATNIKPWGAAWIHNAYNARGQRTSEIFADANGKLVNAEVGYAKKEWYYSPDGDLYEAHAYNASGAEVDSWHRRP